MLATEGLAEFHDTGDFLREADTARAIDAPGQFCRHQRPQILVGHYTFFFLIVRRRTTIADRQILQLAFATLVANRAIQRMVDEQEFHHPLLR